MVVVLVFVVNMVDGVYLLVVVMVLFVGEDDRYVEVVYIVKVGDNFL